MALTSATVLPPHPQRSSTSATGAPSVAHSQSDTAKRAASLASSCRPSDVYSSDTCQCGRPQPSNVPLYRSHVIKADCVSSLSMCFFTSASMVSGNLATRRVRYTGTSLPSVVNAPCSYSAAPTAPAAAATAPLAPPLAPSPLSASSSTSALCTYSRGDFARRRRWMPSAATTETVLAASPPLLAASLGDAFAFTKRHTTVVAVAASPPLATRASGTHSGWSPLRSDGGTSVMPCACSTAVSAPSSAGGASEATSCT
mmetsp:Transcript_10047/g.24735  ORF Transcript_10047/g.24735 Transcript_10047/m.24735 type:complete len:257 (-) Transcript_10047:109-879(-)